MKKNIKNDINKKILINSDETVSIRGHEDSNGTTIILFKNGDRIILHPGDEFTIIGNTDTQAIKDFLTNI